MKTCHAAAGLLLAGALAAGGVNAPYPDDSDHTIYIQLRSEPKGAEILSVPTEPGEKPTLVGLTPHVLVLELKWDRPLIRKDWRRLAVWSPGNVGKATYDEKEQRHDIFVTLAAAAPGYRTEMITTRVASFYKEGFDWDKADSMPTKTVLNLVLTPITSSVAVAAGSMPPDAGRPAALRTVMIASGRDGARETGMLVIAANVAGADVLVDGQKAGETPLRLIIPTGPHAIEVRKAGYQSASEQVIVKSQVEGTLQVTLVKAPK